VDAFSHNYRVAVVEEGYFDRAQSSHAMTLCDLQAKYADVVKLDEITAFIATIPKGLFELPPS
jgi:isochorismate hydrolase